ncbi:MAG: phosphatase [Bacillota bacterium]
MEIVADLHTHTIACGHAYSTLEEMAHGARRNGIEILATTDHGPVMPGANHPYYFNNLAVLPEEIAGVRVLKGVEANITDTAGTLDLAVESLKRMDLVLAGLHSLTGYEGDSVAENTQALVKTIENPLVDIIVHPGNPRFAANFERVIEAAIEHDVLLEINNSSFRGSRFGSWDNCLEVAKLAVQAGLEVVIGSDAHFSDDVGRVDQALELALQAGLERSDILNTSLRRVKEFVAAKAKVKERVK